jgi:hypothetical protein
MTGAIGFLCDFSKIEGQLSKLIYHHHKSPRNKSSVSFDSAGVKQKTMAGPYNNGTIEIFLTLSSRN